MKLEARADFTNILVPLQNSSKVLFKPCGILLDKLASFNVSHYYIRIKVVSLVENSIGEILRGGEVKIEYRGKMLCTCIIRRIDKLDIFFFYIEKFPLGKGLLKVFYLPKRSKNLVWMVYNFEE
ncbi:MAG: hypothetical protein DRJ52_04070 [Thermoprotei archaeon]|nr:MAG: hypothetical protein DRJ52_04070 [Thermoprotei archaeon]